MPSTMSRPMTGAILTLILAIAFAGVSYLAPDFMGYRDDQLPIPQPDPPLQPAGYAFAIWGLIYGWLIVSAIFGVAKRAEAPDWVAVRPPLMLALLLGTPWTAIANASAPWATIVIFLMLAGALVALFRAPEADRWWLRAPVALLAGWLTAASFVSLGVTLAGFGIGLDMTGWTWACIIMALAVAIAVQSQIPEPLYGAAVIWALIGLAVENWASRWELVALALVGAVAVAATAWWRHAQPRPA